MKSTRNSRFIIADTGYWVALGNAGDRHHLRAMKVFKTLQDMPITTWPVVTETCHLLARRTGFAAQQAFIHALENGACRLLPLELSHLPRIQQLMQQYRDLPMDLADASLVILAEELGHGRILSTDQRDFRTYRWKNHAPFDNRLLPGD